MMRAKQRRLQRVFRLARAERGVATIEFAMVVSMMAVGILNVFDIARYYHQRMEVENATQMAVQSAWSACDIKKLPAKTQCPGLTAALNAGLQGTSLGSTVTLKSGFPTEGYYCLNAANQLVLVSGIESKPANCNAVGKSGELPGDYIRVETSYTFKPLFPGASVGSLLPTPIIYSATSRLG